MYLTGKRYLWYNENKLKSKIQKSIGSEFEPKEVEFEIIYWRKANAIHKWFVDNVQNGKDDCGTYEVNKEQLKSLLKTVNDAIHSIEPEKILPTQSGFFFGSTDYDEGYIEDLITTKEGIEKILNSSELKMLDIQYHSSW